MNKLILLVCFGLWANLTWAQQPTPDFVVAADGSGDFRSVQQALDAVPHLRKARTVIYIKNGVYKEKLHLPSNKTNVSLIGQDKHKTVLTYDDFAQKKNRFGEEMGTSASASFFVDGDGFYAENITFVNAAGPVGQAVAVRIDGDMAMFVDCRFLGNQDTLYPHGEKSRQYYRHCYIEGTVDFIFGWSTCVFDQCEIFCKGTGWVTAASTLDEAPFGFVFLNCNVHGQGTATHNLGRPWRPYAKVAFIGCDISNAVKPEGWDNWGKASNEATAQFREHGNKGEGARTDSRVKWARLLSADEVGAFSVENVLGGWSPDKDFVIK